jgi:hypothetical protein
MLTVENRPDIAPVYNNNMFTANMFTREHYDQLH